jgi:hypothetical protein
MNELLDDNWEYTNFLDEFFCLIESMDESNSKIVMTNGNDWTHIIFMSNFIR